MTGLHRRMHIVCNVHYVKKSKIGKHMAPYQIWLRKVKYSLNVHKQCETGGQQKKNNTLQLKKSSIKITLSFVYEINTVLCFL